MMRLQNFVRRGIRRPVCMRQQLFKQQTEQFCQRYFGSYQAAEFPSDNTAGAPTANGRRRVGFQLKLNCKPELLEDYKDSHTKVWPEMQEALRRCGWHNYSLFLGPEGVMFGYFETEHDLDTALTKMGAEAINEVWQNAHKKYAPDTDTVRFLESHTLLSLQYHQLNPRKSRTNLFFRLHCCDY